MARRFSYRCMAAPRLRTRGKAPVLAVPEDDALRQYERKAELEASMLLFVEGYVMGQDLDLSSGLAVRRGELVEAGLGGAIDELVHFGLLTGMHGERRRFVLARHLLHGRQHNTRLCVSPAGARLPMPQPERQPSPPPRPRRRDPPVAVGLPIAPPPQQPPPPPQPVQPQQPPPPTPPPTAPALPPSARRRPTCCAWGFLTTGLPVVHMLLLSISTKYILCQHTAHRRPLQETTITPKPRSGQEYLFPVSVLSV